METTMTPTLDAFFAGLDRYDDHVPIKELADQMRALSIDLDDVRDFVHFSNDGYQRNLMRRGSAYDALIICWKNGQRSPIHDHEGSSCGVLVIAGTATEICYVPADDGWIRQAGSRELCQGGVCGSYDRDTHELANIAPDGSDLVTLHIYSPPLGRVGIYSQEHRTRSTVESPMNILPETVQI
jgi:cysteine dioxygenase